MPFKLNRKAPHPNETHPRVYVDDFFKEVVVPKTVSYGETVSYPMDLNDSEGDCGIAGMDHLQMAWRAASGKPVASWGDAECQKLYETLGGYVPGNPSTDNGTVLQDNLAYWQKTGVNGDKLQRFGALRNWDKATRLQALYYFGPLYLGIWVPQSMPDQFNAGQPFTFVPGSPNVGGHCVVDCAEDAGMDEVRLITWGKVWKASEQFLMATTEEAWVAIDPDFLNAQAAVNPHGIDLAAMNAALAQLG